MIYGYGQMPGYRDDDEVRPLGAESYEFRSQGTARIPLSQDPDEFEGTSPYETSSIHSVPRVITHP